MLSRRRTILKYSMTHEHIIKSSPTNRKGQVDIAPFNLLFIFEVYRTIPIIPQNMEATT